MQRDIIELVSHQVFGHTAVARSSIQAGEAVSVEKPLVCTSTRSRRGGGALEKQLDELRAFAQANNEVQRKVLGSLYCPDPTASSSAKLLERSSPAAKEAVKLGIITEQLVSQLRHAPSVPLSDTHDLALRVLLIFEGNAFFYAGDDRDDEGDDSPYDCGSGNSGVYLIGSKYAHTCGAPNVRYRSRRADVPHALHGKGVFGAMCDIAACEVLAVNYLSTQEAMQSTIARYACSCNPRFASW